MKTTIDWIQKADVALRRAALRARETAMRTNTGIYVLKDGRIVKLTPQRTTPVVREETPPQDTKFQ